MCPSFGTLRRLRHGVLERGGDERGEAHVLEDGCDDKAELGGGKALPVVVCLYRQKDGWMDR